MFSHKNKVPLKQLVPILYKLLVCLPIFGFSQSINLKEWVDSIPLQEQPVRFDLSNLNPNERVLTETQVEFLQIEQFITMNDSIKSSLHVPFRLDLSKDYHTFISVYKDLNGVRHSYLANYSLNFELVDWIKVAYTQRSKRADYMNFRVNHGWLSTDRKQQNRTFHQTYIISPKGKIKPYRSRDLASFLNDSCITDIRLVSNKKGAVLKNENGRPIETLLFGDDVGIITYLNKNKAEVVSNIFDFNKHMHFSSFPYEKTYINPQDLYPGNGKNKVGWRMNNGKEMERTKSLNVSSIGTAQANLDLSSFVEIEKVSIKEYSNFQYAQNITPIGQLGQKTGKLELPLINGKTVVYEETFYEGEYDFTNYYKKVECRKLDENYIIYFQTFEHFSYISLSKKNGDTTAIFNGYPFASPSSKNVISLSAPYSYDTATVIMQVFEHIDNNFKVVWSAEFTNWNLPRHKVIYWIDDKEFILKCKSPGYDGEEEEADDIFYLKFKLKDMNTPLKQANKKGMLY